MSTLSHVSLSQRKPVMSTAWKARFPQCGSHSGEKLQMKNRLERRSATGSANTSTVWRVTDPIANAMAPSDSTGMATNTTIGRT